MNSADFKTNAYLNFMEIDSLPRLKADITLQLINFDHNQISEISSNAFINMIKVEEISLAYNSLKTIPSDLFEKNVDLRILNLSHNSFSTLPNSLFNDLSALKNLDLSFNQFKILSVELLNTIKLIETVSLDSNKLLLIDVRDLQNSVDIENLILSRNEINQLTATTFESFVKLKSLDLSHNKLRTISENSFTKTIVLANLNLSFNKLESLPQFNGLSTLSSLFLEGNELTSFYFYVELTNLDKLQLANNRIKDFAGSDTQALQIFNVSGNELESLKDLYLSNVRTLDISNNQFKKIPQNLGIIAPVLENLFIGNNPFQSIVFESELSLKSLSIKNQSTLNSLNKEIFKNIKPSENLSEKSEAKCINLTISHCTNLKEIKSNAFENLNFCKLDLSYNNLSSLPRNLTKWNMINGDLNLQGNPFHCSCDDKWMLDILMPIIYDNKINQNLLHELRCASPKPVEGKRFIRFFRPNNRTLNSFCPLSEKMIDRNPIASASMSDEKGFQMTVDFNKGPSYITVIIACIVVLVALVIFGVWWNRQLKVQDARKNRLYSSY